MYRRMHELTITLVLVVGIVSAGLTSVAVAETNVSGEITTTTWTAANAPYHVTAACTVATGNTLTIEPGIDVLFDADVPFIVEGALDAVGTEADSIRFVKGTADEWGGIRISGGDSSTVHCARISDGRAQYGGGVHVAGSRLAMLNSVVSGNAGDMGGGLYLSGGSADLSECIISGNSAGQQGGGMKVSSSTVTLTGCTIEDNAAGPAPSTTMASGQGGGVYATGGTLTIRNSTMKRNTCGQWGGAVRIASGTAYLYGCVLQQNEAYGNTMDVSGSMTLSNCLLTGNRTYMVDDCPIDSTGEVYNNGESCGFAAHGTATLINCTIADNVSAGGREVGIGNVEPTVVTLVNTISWGHWADYYRCPKGFWCPGGRAYPQWEGSPLAATYSDAGTVWYDTWEGEGLISADPMFADPENGDYSLLPGSPCIDAGDPHLRDEDGSRSDMGYTGGRGPSPDGPVVVLPREVVFPHTFAASLGVANGGWADLTLENLSLPDGFSTTAVFPQTLAPGEEVGIDLAYSGPALFDTTITVHSSDVHLPAQEVRVVAGPSILAGRVNGILSKTNSPYHVFDTLRVAAADTLYVAYGVTMQFDAPVPLVVDGVLEAIGQSAEWKQIHFEPGAVESWGGIKIAGGDSSSMKYVTISGSHDSGIEVSGDGTRLWMDNCTVSGNTSDEWRGSVAVGDSAVVWLTGCVISENEGAGVGAEYRGTTVQLADCEITDNSGIGLVIVGGPSAVVTLCTFARNAGGGLVAMAHPKEITLAYCLIHDNTGYGGIHGSSVAVAAPPLDLALVNCTVTNNSPHEISGEFLKLGVTNCIVWGAESDTAIDVDGTYGTLAIAYSDIQGDTVWAGEGNINDDPMFADTLDYELYCDSPCVAAGEGGVNMGWIESGCVPVIPAIAAVRPPAFALSPAFPNPFNPATRIGFSIPEAGAVRLAVYDVNGRYVRTVVDEYRRVGHHAVVWDGRDDLGRSVASGVYIVRLTAGDMAKARRVTLLR